MRSVQGSPFCSISARAHPILAGSHGAASTSGREVGLCFLPLSSGGHALGTLNVYSHGDANFSQEEVELLSRVASQAALAMDNALAFRQIAELKEKLAEQNQYLEEELRTEALFDDIIGESVVLKRILKQVEMVAATDATVLILGETGTGKELIARAIHNLSARRENAFVKLNCAAIPVGLLESELFGYEKGAFTGASSRKSCRLDLAHRGTLFLDEVGRSPWNYSQNFCESYRSRNLKGWAARVPFRSTFGSSPPRIVI